MANNNFKCPTWLDKEAKSEWKRVIKELIEKEEIKAADTKALEGYCQSYSKWKSCEKYIQEHGYTFSTPNGYEQQRPEVSIGNKAQSEMRAWARELGLTPSSRSRIKAPSSVEDEDEEMGSMIAK